MFRADHSASSGVARDDDGIDATRVAGLTAPAVTDAPSGVAPPPPPGRRPRRILAVASAGGHWVQLLRMSPALDGQDVAFATTHASNRAMAPPGARFYVVPDANRTTPLRMALMLVRLAWIILRERPDVVLSTGAAPGYAALRLGKLVRAQTIWVDSIANAGRLSMSGERAGRCADLWLTQWPHLAREDGPIFRGSVL